MKVCQFVRGAIWSLTVFTAAAFAADGDEAMFGLKWGMNPSDLKAIGIALAKTKGERNLETYKTTSLPKNLSEVESYILIFADGKLAKITAIGKDITNDPTGSSGKDRVESLTSALTDKYGKPSNNYQSIGNKLFKEYDEFYQCLAYSGCGQWATIYEPNDKDISVELKGQRRGSGYILLTVESKPQWSKALEIFKTRRNSSDKDAL